MGRYTTTGFRQRMPKIILAIVFCLLMKRVFSQNQSFELKPFQFNAPPPRSPPSANLDRRTVVPNPAPSTLQQPLPLAAASQPNLRSARLISPPPSSLQQVSTGPEIAGSKPLGAVPINPLDVVKIPTFKLPENIPPISLVKTIQPFSLEALTPPPPSSTTPVSPPILRVAPSLIQSVTPSSSSKFAWTPFSVQIQGNSVILPTQSPRGGPSFNAGACPRTSFGPCKCSEPEQFEATDLPVLDCSRIFSPTELMALRLGAGVHFSRIVLRGTGITALPTGAFGFHRADEYWITDNPVLTTVEPNAFGFQADPKKLILQNNQIEKFPFQDLSRFRNLEYFVANGNALDEIPPDAFSIPGGSLVDILLHDNQIRKIGPRAFGNLNNLNAVTLHNNALDEIKSEALYFTGTPQTLSLSGNQIAKVDKEAFGGMIPRIIDLSQNDMDEFPREPWAIVLHSLARMNEEDPRNPSRLILTGNPMRCECDVFWLYQSSDILAPTVDGFFCSETRIPMNLFDLPRRHFFPNCL